MAEKLETVIRRGRASTRPRDYYDIHSLWATRRDELPLDDLKTALIATSTKRNSIETLDDYRSVMDVVAVDEVMLRRWDAFAKEYSYVGTLTLLSTCGTVCEILDSIGW